MLTESQAAFGIGLWGQSRAKSFCLGMLAMLGVSAPALTAGAETDRPIQELSAGEKAACDKKALDEWNAPEPDSTHEQAVKYILTNSGCLSSEVRKYLGVSKNEWSYALAKLNNDPRVRKQGKTLNMRWYKA